MNRGDGIELLQRARGGDREALGSLLERHRPMLLRMVGLRLDAALLRRLDAADVVQEVFLDIERRFADGLVPEQLPFHVWLRLEARNRLTDLRRRHLGAGARDARREVGADDRASASSACAHLASVVVDPHTSPTLAARRAEMVTRVEQALAEMDAIDREVLILRHFEDLTNEDAAAELSIAPAAASKRFVRALRRLKAILGTVEPA